MSAVTPTPPLPVTMRAQVTVPAPFHAPDLAAFVAHVPSEAEITVVTREGGNQRDPYPVSYVFTAEWKGEA